MEFEVGGYEVLWQRVQDMSKKMDKMEQQLDDLIALANRFRGGFWFGMSMVSGISAIVGFIISNWRWR